MAFQRPVIKQKVNEVFLTADLKPVTAQERQTQPNKLDSNLISKMVRAY
ncbi:MAG: hypothetical protein MPEBLZ_00026 [Candidatus Methanoperedens nitroreducens]|uniref:Uncharacterized protein n=1 Tax=Candidatus Methanoperedens nitratireducens TaxID=1392998 RepID=A0A0P8CE79_9EURY|nr:MAG: hypothetical protein MPEBLZ_00026 [Candidatus Methanoperedens sp. BLZ1]